VYYTTENTIQGNLVAEIYFQGSEKRRGFRGEKGSGSHDSGRAIHTPLEKKRFSFLLLQARRERKGGCFSGSHGFLFGRTKVKRGSSG